MAAEITKVEKLKLETIANPQFMAAMSELAAFEMPARASYWIGKSITKLESHLLAYDKARIKSLKKYSELDKNGEMVTDEKTKGVKFKTPEDEAAFKKELEELRAEEVEVLKIACSVLVPEKGNDSEKDLKIKPWIFSALDALLY